MKLKLLFSTVIITVVTMLALASARSDTDGTSMLFIGNSLTSANDFPKLTAALAESSGRNVSYGMYAPGGRRLLDHAADKQLMQLIKKRSWEYVVLQDQSQYPAFTKKQIKRDVYPWAKELVKAVKDAQPHANVIFYMTMAHQNGDQKNAHVSEQITTYRGMQERINSTYTKMAKQNRGILAPVGVAWQKARRKRRKINIYSDPVHPNLSGSYLAACVFFSTLFQESPLGLDHPQSIEPSQAKFLQEVAHETVMGSSKRWDWR